MVSLFGESEKLLMGFKRQASGANDLVSIDIEMVEVHWRGSHTFCHHSSGKFSGLHGHTDSKSTLLSDTKALEDCHEIGYAFFTTLPFPNYQKQASQLRSVSLHQILGEVPGSD